MGETGCVGWMFKQKGVLTIEKETLSLSEDDLLLLALDKGRKMKTDDEDVIEIFTDPPIFKVKEGLEKKG